MEFLDKRIGVICDQLKKLRVKKSEVIENWTYKEGNYIRPVDADEAMAEWKVFDSKTMHWYGPDKHYWFRAEYTVPEHMNNQSIWLQVKTQIEEWDDGKNPQFLLYLDKVPVQGIDMNHREVLIADKAEAGKTYTLDLQSYTGTLHSEFNLIVYMQEIDLAIQKLYYDIWVPISAFTRMKKDDRIRMEIQNVLNETINLLDLRTPYSEDFYTSLEAAQKYINKALYFDMAGFSDIIATCIGHTHIDVAWWWTVEQTREKVGRSFATVLKLMEEYPSYKFMSSQPQLYYFLKERYPELYERLKMAVEEKRWEPEGGMWVEADCNLTSGESLVRQFMHGKQFFKEEFGIENKILWLPDVFGYSGALPQIMKKCGIDYFMTTKLAWNQFNKMPHDTLYWKGIDGTKIFTHLITTLGVGQPAENFFTTYNGMLHPDAIMGGWERYQNKEINNDILISYGYGDGGGGPTREMLETSIRMEQGIKGIPKVRQEFSRTYFDELIERVGDHKRLPEWEGEFYFEYHRGTYTSMARNKRSNRKSELMLMDLELLGVLAMDQLTYPAKKLDEMWKTVLINQFHDILPGSSIHEVYEVTKKQYAELAKDGAEMIAERLRAITDIDATGSRNDNSSGRMNDNPVGNAGRGTDGSAVVSTVARVKNSGEKEVETVTIYNTLGFNRNDIVVLSDEVASVMKDEASGLADEAGNVYPVQQTKDGAAVYLRELPSKGSKTFRVVKLESAVEETKSVESDLNQTFTISNGVLDTPFYQITINEGGLFTSIYDKENDREVVQAGETANQFVMYEDKPIYYDNWDIDIFHTEKFWKLETADRMEWTEFGPVRATLEIERSMSRSVVKQKIYFYADSRRIDFDTYVDWKESQHLLKVHFPVDIHSDEATFDIQFGNLTRKVHTNTSWDMARFESCGQKWIDLSEGYYGVSLLNDCKYGHSVKDANMAITLIKSGIEPNPVTDQEEHFFTYSLYPHAEGWRQANTVQEAYKLNLPAYAVTGGAIGTEKSFVQVDAKNVILETVKLAEDQDGVIIRLYESENARTKTVITLPKGTCKVEECNLIEEFVEEVPVKDGKVTVVVKPYEIKTYRIK